MPELRAKPRVCGLVLVLALLPAFAGKRPNMVELNRTMRAPCWRLPPCSTGLAVVDQRLHRAVGNEHRAMDCGCARLRKVALTRRTRPSKGKRTSSVQRSANRNRRHLDPDKRLNGHRAHVEMLHCIADDLVASAARREPPGHRDHFNLWASFRCGTSNVPHSDEQVEQNARVAGWVAKDDDRLPDRPVQRRKAIRTIFELLKDRDWSHIRGSRQVSPRHPGDGKERPAERAFAKPSRLEAVRKGGASVNVDSAVIACFRRAIQ